jgi:hypothetical protein
MIIKLFIILLMLISGTSFAERSPTNINDVSDLFPKNIADKDKIEAEIDAKKKAANGSVASKEALSVLQVKEQEAEAKTNKLNSINANSLEEAGQVERAKLENSFFEELEIDYSDPKIANHKTDTDKIAESTTRLVSRLIEGLKDLGVDCRQVKGNKEIEPDYYLDIKLEAEKDTIYNQHICEQLRNHYNCSDRLQVKCSKRGTRYSEWQNKRIELGGLVVYHQARHLGYGQHWKKKRVGWHIHQDPGGWRAFLANYLHIPIEQIDHLSFPYGPRGLEPIYPVYDEWRVVFDKYVIDYKYRDTYQVCEQWSEEWHEGCNLSW